MREAERSSVAAVANKHGMSTETICKWRRSFGGPEASDELRIALHHRQRGLDLRKRQTRTKLS